MVSAYPVLAITSLRVTPTANRNSFRVALSFIIVPRVEALRTSTLGYEIATPTELPRVRTILLPHPTDTHTPRPTNPSLPTDNHTPRPTNPSHATDTHTHRPTNPSHPTDTHAPRPTQPVTSHGYPHNPTNQLCAPRDYLHNFSDDLCENYDYLHKISDDLHKSPDHLCDAGDHLYKYPDQLRRLVSSETCIRAFRNACPCLPKRASAPYDTSQRRGFWHYYRRLRMMLNAIAAFSNSPILKIKEIYFVISSVYTLYGIAVKLGGTSTIQNENTYVFSLYCLRFALTLCRK